MSGIPIDQLCESLSSFLTITKILGMVIIDDYKLVKHTIPSEVLELHDNIEEKIPKLSFNTMNLRHQNVMSKVCSAL